MAEAAPVLCPRPVKVCGETKKFLSSPETAETSKIRGNHCTLCLSKKSVMQHQAQSPAIQHPSVIFDTSVTSFSFPYCKYVLAPPAKGETINLLWLYLSFWHICSTSHRQSVFRQMAERKHFCMRVSGSLSYKQYFYCEFLVLHILNSAASSVFQHDIHCFFMTASVRNTRLVDEKNASNTTLEL